MITDIERQCSVRRCRSREANSGNKRFAAVDLERIKASDLRRSYLEEIAEDPNLTGITTMAALRARLEELSAVLTAQDAGL